MSSYTEIVRITGPLGPRGDFTTDALNLLAYAGSGAGDANFTPPDEAVSTQTPYQQRTFSPPSKGIKFTAAFYTPTDLSENTYLFSDTSSNSELISLYWYNKTLDVSFSKTEDIGITVITVQTISAETFPHYLGAHTIQFSNWDFSANSPENLSGVGTNGQNIFKSHSSNKWDPSATMLVGIPTNYSNNYDIVDISHVAFPVAITTSEEPSFNAISYTQDISFIDLYAVLGRPKIENIIAYNENLVQITSDLSWVTISGEAASSASMIHTNPINPLRSIQQSKPAPKPIIPRTNVEQSKPEPKPIIPRTNIQQTPKILLPPFTGPPVIVR